MRVLIVGGGIGGLTAALCLHDAGIEAVVYESAPALRELGVGINLLPTAAPGLLSAERTSRLYRVGFRLGTRPARSKASSMEPSTGKRAASSSAIS